MANQEFIQKYKNENIILTSNFKTKDNIEISNIVNPYELDFRQLCSPTDNQFTNPHCAGYAAAQLTESIYWQVTGVPIQLDANQIYFKAKEIDGMPHIDGTHPEYTLIASLKLCEKKLNIFSKYEVKTFYNSYATNAIEKLKFLIHKHMFLLGGFRITESWYRVTHRRNVILKNDSVIGNHACLICGYNKKCFIVQNSWGKNWGSKGFAQISNDVLNEQLICVSYLAKKDV